MQFEFATSGRIIFGPGTVAQLPETAAQMGRVALVVHGCSGTLVPPLLTALDAQGVRSVSMPVCGEPTVDLAREGKEIAIEQGADLVIGFGGGSAIDSAKAIAAIMTNPGDPLDYLEVIGAGQKLKERPAPMIAVPTTAGTGAEVTRNAVLASPQHQVKVSMRSPRMLPLAAFVDPELTYSLPPEVTASTGMDALTQLIEPYVTLKRNPLTDAIAREGMQRAARSLRKAYENGLDVSAREDMALASLFGGLALANAGLGAVHGFAGPIGGMFDAPHGAVCASLLPYVVQGNLKVLTGREPDNPVLQRYLEAAQILTGNPDAIPEDAVSWLLDLSSALNIPGLSGFGIAPEDFPVIVEKSAVASSMKGNPVRLTPDEMRSILEHAL